MIFLQAGEVLIALSLQFALSSWVFIAGAKPNLLLVALLVSIMRWNPRWLFLLGGMAGLVMDVLSHGLLGVYGICLLGVCLLGGALRERMEAGGALLLLLVVLAGSLLYGWASGLLLQWAQRTAVDGWRMALVTTPLAALYNLLLLPCWAWTFSKLERRLGYVP